MFEIDSDIRRAETLESCFYTEDGHFTDAKKKIFSRTSAWAKASMPAWRSRMTSLHIGLLLFPKMTQLDLTGPLQVFSRLPGATVHLVAKSMLAAFDAMGGRPRGFALVTANHIPHGRGLGSSSAAIVGGINAPVTFAGLAPGFMGLYQVNAQIPVGVTPGNSVPVIVTQAGSASNIATIAVQ